jgi:orotate phosphoribosyltransferase
MPASNIQKIDKALHELGCVLEGKYFFAFENGRAATKFIDSSAIYTKPALVEIIASELIHCFPQQLLPDVKVIAAPSPHVAPLAQAVARQFPNHGLETPDVIFAEADKDFFSLGKRFGKIIAGRPVLLVEDVVFTGRPLRKAAEAIHAAGGQVVGAAALLRYEGIDIEDVLMPVFPVLPRIPSYNQIEHQEWFTWPLVENFGHPEVYPHYAGPNRPFPQ